MAIGPLNQAGREGTLLAASREPPAVTSPAQFTSPVRFGVFEADLRAGELRRNGYRLRLQEKPFQLLGILLERPGAVVSKEELQVRLWPEVNVDADGGLNEAVYKLRQALDDSVQAPRYVETVPKRGYRFIAAVEAATTEAPDPGRRRMLYGGLALGGALLAGAAIPFGRPGREPSGGRLRQFHIRPDDPVSLPDIGRPHRVAISPDGNYVAWAGASGRLWIRDLREEEPRRLDPLNVYALFWSPDSRHIFLCSERKLVRAAVPSGHADAVCDCGGFSRGAVSNDGATVVYADGPVSRLWQAPAGGGKPELVLTEAEREEILAECFQGAETSLGSFPTFLPAEAGERVLVFGVGEPETPSQRLMIFDMDTRRRRLLWPGSDPVYAPSGHLLYALGRNPVDLWAVPFSLESLEAEGKPFLVRQNAWSPSVSRDETLVFADWSASPRRLVWRNRSGAELGSIGEGEDPRLSPDGSQAAYTLDGDVWVRELAQGTPRRITTEQAGDFRPIWAAGGGRLAFSSPRSGAYDIWTVDLQRGGEPPTPLLATPEPEATASWSRDGRYLAYHALQEGGTWYIGVLDLSDENQASKPRVFSRTGHNEMMLEFHPNSRWVAYQSYVSGDAEIYVERFPEGGGQRAISANRGIQPRWSADGRELFFVGRFRDAERKVPDPGLYVVEVKTEPEFSAGPPRRLFSVSDQTYYDVSADGQRLLLAEEPSKRPGLGIRVVENWQLEFSDETET